MEEPMPQMLQSPFMMTVIFLHPSPRVSAAPPVKDKWIDVQLDRFWDSWVQGGIYLSHSSHVSNLFFRVSIIGAEAGGDGVSTNLGCCFQLGCFVRHTSWDQTRIHHLRKELPDSSSRMRYLGNKHGGTVHVPQPREHCCR